MPRKRKDIHRNSKIEPADYRFIAMEYCGPDPFGHLANVEEKKIIHHHINVLGHKFAGVEHGGTCYACGAYAHYNGVYVHEPTGNLIKLGYVCCDKLEMGDTELFRAKRENLAKFKTGKKKAALILSEEWEIEMDEAVSIVSACGARGESFREEKLKEVGFTVLTYEEKMEGGFSANRHNEGMCIFCDIIGKLISYGNSSEKALAFAKKLYDNRKFDLKAALAAEEAKKPKTKLEEGRYEIKGKVLTIKVDEDGLYGPTVKMLVKLPDGNKVWGTVPSAIGDVEKGDKVSFNGTVTRSDRDVNFGFYKRPAKATILESAEAA